MFWKMFGNFTRNHLCSGSTLEAEVKSMGFFLWVFWKFSEQPRSDKIVFKERRFCEADLKAGILLIAEFFLCFYV